MHLWITSNLICSILKTVLTLFSFVEHLNDFCSLSKNFRKFFKKNFQKSEVIYQIKSKKISPLEIIYNGINGLKYRSGSLSIWLGFHRYRGSRSVKIIGCIKLELRSTKVWWIPGPKFLISLTFKKFCSSCSFFVLSVHLVCFRIMLKMCHFFIFDMLYFRYPDTSTRRCMMSIVKRQCANSIHHKDRICNNRFISIVARSKPTKRPEFVCVNLK